MLVFWGVVFFLFSFWFLKVKSYFGPDWSNCSSWVKVFSQASGLESKATTPLPLHWNFLCEGAFKTKLSEYVFFCCFFFFNTSLCTLITFPGWLLPDFWFPNSNGRVNHRVCTHMMISLSPTLPQPFKESFMFQESEMFTWTAQVCHNQAAAYCIRVMDNCCTYFIPLF